MELTIEREQGICGFTYNPGRGQFPQVPRPVNARLHYVRC
jgi:hypothetical protein